MNKTSRFPSLKKKSFHLPHWVTGGRPSFAKEPFRGDLGITVLIPAYNEERCIADTVRSVLAQTAKIDELIVINDCSTDNTGAIASSLGVKVICTPKNTGSKSSGLDYAMQFVRTPLVCIVDADTVLDPEAIEKLLPYFNDSKTGAVCGFVLVQNKDALGLGRQVEYCAALPLFKGAQSNTNGMVVSNGCFSIYLTHLITETGVFKLPSRAEDMYLTFLIIMKGLKVYCEPDAICYAQEPRNLKTLAIQLRRWKEGFHENVLRAFWDIVKAKQYSLAAFIASAYLDALYIPIIILLDFLFFPGRMSLPLGDRIGLAVLDSVLLLVFGDLLIASIVALVEGQRRGVLKEIVKGLFIYPFMRACNIYFFWDTFVRVFVLKQTAREWGSGH